MSMSFHRSLIAVLVAALIAVGVVLVSDKVSASGPGTPVVYVATGENFPDALGAASAAAVNRGPVLLVRKNSIPGETAAELSRLSPDVIYVVGGPAVISESVENSLGSYASSVLRLAGSNRYATAAEVSKAAFPAGSATGQIEMVTDGFDWRGWGIAPATVVNFITWTRATTSGFVAIGLEGPVSVDGIDYGLDAVQFCFVLTSPAKINNIYIYGLTGTNTFTQTILVDPTDRTGEDCITLNVSAQVPFGAGLGVELQNGGIAELYSVKSTWTPVTSWPSFTPSEATISQEDLTTRELP